LSVILKPENWKSFVNQISNKNGFTLFEVLIALAILAISLTAMIKASSENTVNTAYLRNKYLASLVAANKMNELQLLQNWPVTGNSNGKTELGKYTWKWNIKIETTPDSRLRRVIIDISLDKKEHTLYQSIGYLGQR